MLTEICCCTVAFVIIIIIFFWIFGRLAIIYPRRTVQVPPPVYYQSQPEPQADITMVRCQYCGRMYDETLSGCPGCGGRP